MRDSSFFAVLIRFLDLLSEIADGQEALLQENRDGQTILHLVASSGDEKTLNILLMYTSAVNRSFPLSLSLFLSLSSPSLSLFPRILS